MAADPAVVPGGEAVGAAQPAGGADDGSGAAEPASDGDQPDGPTVSGIDETAAGFAELPRLVDLARTTLLGEGVSTGHLDLVAVDVDDMGALNAEHMGHDGPTDVLSFPLDADLALDADRGDREGAGVDGPPLHLGDVVLCPEVARAQAPDHCGTEEAEFALLVIHGVLHVLGHDHALDDERDRMWARERHHLDRLGHRHPEEANGSW
ncbi:MAG: rRNA maturation RNase YbeY [Actinomycetota bacterium]